MPEIIQAPTDEIKFLFHRGRDEDVFDREIKASIAEIGIRQPLKGIDISSWKPQDRRRPDGGLYRYLAGFGEGRTRAAQELYAESKDSRWKTVPFIVVNVPKGELLTWFLSENLQRVDLPWVDRAELLRADIEAGLTPAELAAKNHMTAGHVEKLLRVLKRTSPKVLDEVRKMTVNEAEVLSRQPHGHQEIIVESLKETGLHGSQTPAVVRLAQEEVAKGLTLSKAVLGGRIERLRQAVKEQRAVLKLKRTHLAIGPQIYGEAILADRRFRKMLDARGVDYRPFLKAWRQ